MNENLKNFINAVGMLTETWSITFKGFKKQGMTDEEAIKHTSAFMSTFMAVLLNHGKEDNPND